MPRIVAKESSFLVQLPAIENTGDSIALKRDKILRYLSDHHGASVKEVAELTMTSLNHSKRILQTMVENNEVFFTGVDADRRYFITDRDTT